MSIKATFIILIASFVYGQDIVDIPAGTEFKINMASILKKQKSCAINENKNYLPNRVFFINGKISCKGSLFQRSCQIDIDPKVSYRPQVLCTLTSTIIDSHTIEMVFDDTKKCPILKCRPLMWTGLFTGPDIGAKSLKHNVGSFVNFNYEAGIDQSIRAHEDKAFNYSPSKFNQTNSVLKK